jgi:hypothetical protein
MERRWFVHARGNQEGPITLSEVHERLNRGVLLSQDFAWCESMETWKRIQEIPELHLLPSEDDVSRVAGVASSASVRLTGELTDRRESVRESAGSPKRRIRWALGAAFIATVFLVAYQMGWLKPGWGRFPSVAGLSDAENQTLLAATEKKLSKEGAQVAAVLGNPGSPSPVLHLATNLPEGAQLEIWLQGIGPTLLNEVEFSIQFPVTVVQHSAKTPALRMRDGAALPAGQYTVTVLEGPSQLPSVQSVLDQLPAAGVPQAGLPAGRRVFSQQTYTLLAGLRDETYTTLLRESHTRWREQAALELKDLQDWLGQLEQRFASSISAFDKLKEQPVGDSRRKQWLDFRKEWDVQIDPLRAKLDAFRPGAPRSKVFYGPLFDRAYLTVQTLNRVSDLQGTAMSPPADVGSYWTEIDSTRSQVKDRLGDLQAKLQAITEGWSQSGYPPREGIL